MRVGIFGGSFNPFHVGHYFVATAALESCRLDKVLLMPCNVSPFKTNDEPWQLSGEDRLAMLRDSVGGDQRFGVTDLELRRGGVSYAVDSVAEIKSEYPGDELFFIIGMDSLHGLCHWRDVRRLLTMCDIITVARPGVALPDADELGFDAETGRRLVNGIIQGRLCDISSSEIRSRVAKRQEIRYLVPPAVEKRLKAIVQP